MPIKKVLKLSTRERLERRRWKRKHGPSAKRRAERRLLLQPKPEEPVVIEQ